MPHKTQKFQPAVLRYGIVVANPNQNVVMTPEGMVKIPGPHAQAAAVLLAPTFASAGNSSLFPSFLRVRPTLHELMQAQTTKRRSVKLYQGRTALECVNLSYHEEHEEEYIERNYFFHREICWYTGFNNRVYPVLRYLQLCGRFLTSYFQLRRIGES